MSGHCVAGVLVTLLCGCECFDGGLYLVFFLLLALLIFSRSVFVLCKEFRLELACCCPTSLCFWKFAWFLAEAHLHFPVARMHPKATIDYSVFLPSWRFP